MGQWDDLIATILTDRSAESQHLLDRDPLKWGCLGCRRLSNSQL